MIDDNYNAIKFLLITLGLVGLVIFISAYFFPPEDITVCIELDTLFLDDPSFINFKTTYPHLTDYLSEYRDDCRSI